MGGFAIHLSFNNFAEEFYLPVNPEQIDIKEANKGKTYDIVGNSGSTKEARAGEINVIKGLSLKEVSFSSVFPAVWYPGVVVKPQAGSFGSTALLLPSEYLTYIKGWMRSKRPIRFHAVSSSYVIDMPASIEKFDWKEVGGSPGDIEFSMTLKEYVFYSAQKIIAVTESSGKTVITKKPPDRPDERIRPGTYTLKAGDNLTKVAAKFYNLDTSRAKDIQKLNSITEAQTKKLQVGMVIKLPKN